MDLSYEISLSGRGYKAVAGVDEAGRGPLAGPVTAACCILDSSFPVKVLKDSKLMPPDERRDAYKLIEARSVAFSYHSVNHKFIDKYGIVPAITRAMNLAIKKVLPAPDYLLIDGYNINIPRLPQEAVVRGDATMASIAAASIIAKVKRDEEMTEYGQLYPEYEYENHKGYCTRRHVEILRKHGPSPIQRLSFTIPESWKLNHTNRAK